MGRTLSEGIVIQRNRLGLTQKQVAERTGLSVGTIQRIEHLEDHMHVGMRNIIKVLVALDLRLEFEATE